MEHLKLNTPDSGIVVTIDDGPNDEHCQDFLAACAEINLKTFCFVLGKQLKAHPDLAKKMIDHGHVLCNHTFSHPHMTQLSREQQEEELDRCTEEIVKLTGAPSPWFRFPYGDCDEPLMELVESRNMISVGKKMYTKDTDRESTPEQIIEHLNREFHPDGILLGHHWSAATRKALQTLVPKWREQGCFGELNLEVK